jgi:cytochrome c-type biogenesis protein CcmH/NrfG
MSDAVTNRRSLALVLGIGLVVIFAVSIGYRFTHPSRVFHNQPQQAAEAGARNESMNRIGALMQRLQENPENVDVLLRLSAAFLRMEAWDRAFDFASRAADLEPENKQALHFMGVARFQAGDAASAGEIFARILEIDPDDPDALFNLGIIQKHFTDKPGQARDKFQKIVDEKLGGAEVQERARDELAGIPR